jgi:hypothetical protein
MPLSLYFPVRLTSNHLVSYRPTENDPTIMRLDDYLVWNWIEFTGLNDRRQLAFSLWPPHSQTLLRHGRYIAPTGIFGDNVFP